MRSGKLSIQIWLSPDTYGAVEKAAKKDRRPIAQWARLAVEEKLERLAVEKVKEGPAGAPTDPPTTK